MRDARPASHGSSTRMRTEVPLSTRSAVTAREEERRACLERFWARDREAERACQRIGHVEHKRHGVFDLLGRYARRQEGAHVLVPHRPLAHQLREHAQGGAERLRNRRVVEVSERREDLGLVAVGSLRELSRRLLEECLRRSVDCAAQNVARRTLASTLPAPSRRPAKSAWRNASMSVIGSAPFPRCGRTSRAIGPSPPSVSKTRRTSSRRRSHALSVCRFPSARILDAALRPERVQPSESSLRSMPEVDVPGRGGWALLTSCRRARVPRAAQQADRGECGCDCRGEADGGCCR